MGRQGPHGWVKFQSAPTAVYIVAVTGWAKDEDRHRALTAGFDDHVAKPVPLERLIRLVERASLKRHTAPFPGTSD